MCLYYLSNFFKPLLSFFTRIECGKPNPHFMTLIAHGDKEIEGNSPWHVAIYDTWTQNKQICGGTIMSPQLILSGDLKN